ncbi:hypothetical protein GQ55_2G017100 [Panicum hallii var. hallii]|uniref:C2H2-type domain-containing protein n=1 Tax=Panicum hallii var. hallii TaxID=1504633 RepID=A0A2T7EKG7_9POAL|nr:hypothetical protein GQ55_2G017100 [Panicum hallii var. hallii]
MASGSAQDRWWRGRRCHADLDDEDELEEGEVDAGCHSDTDTEEYYNRHSPIETDETTSDGCETGSVVVPPDDGDASPCPSTVARGCSGAAASPTPSAEPEPDQPMGTVGPAEPKVFLQPVLLAFAAPNNLSPVPMASARASLSGQSSSAQPVRGDAMEVSPPTEAVVHQQPVAPPPAAAAAAGEQSAPVVHHQPPPAAAAGAGRQNPNGYTCKKCGMWFESHQGLGGHMVGHKNRELAAGDGAAPAGRGNPRPERPHVCDQCGAEFRTGVQLGGHKRKHWNGPPIVPKKKPRAVSQPLSPPAEAAADLKRALSSVIPDEASPAVEAARPAAERTPESAVRPPAAGRVLLFGIDIGPGVQTPEAHEGPPAPATESSASTGGKQ